MDLNLNIIILARDARSYYDAYEVLREKHVTDLSAPALLCLAFSIELHVKLLLRTSDIIVTGHDIGKLLKKLPEEDIAYISNHPDFHPTQQGNGFFENIDKASNLFIRTRYYFEKMDTLHFNTGFCITLAKVIRKRIVERVPDLRYDLGLFSE
jgi:hypothetical protein